jgi:TolB protein
VIPSSGGDTEKITLPGSYNSDPAWSPDGKKIAYTSRVGGGFSVWVYDLEKRTSMQVSSGLGEDPSWTRNSRHLVYSTGGALHVLDTLTKQAVRIENGLSSCTEPSVTR